MGEVINIGVPDWERKVTEECMKFIDAVVRNFRFGLTNSLQYLPNQMDPQQRAIQLQYFIDSMIGVCIQNLTEFHSRDPLFEDLVVESVRNKFAYIRENWVEPKAQSKVITAPESPIA